MIADLTESVLETYASYQENLLVSIAANNDVSFSCGHYQDYFDGLLECRKKKFHIHLNMDRLKGFNTPRCRFTFAHELGHFYIDEHRNALLRGLRPHALLHQEIPDLLVEQEANYFASCLLMPKQEIIDSCKSMRFTFNLIEKLSKDLGVSRSAFLFRYTELKISPILIIIIKDGLVRSYHGDTFELKSYLKQIISKPPPFGSLSYTYLRQGTKSDQPIPTDPKVWFNIGEKYVYQYNLLEQCLYIDTRSVISVIWLE